MPNIKYQNKRIFTSVLLALFFTTASAQESPDQIAALLESGQLQQARSALEHQTEDGREFLFLNARLAELEGNTERAIELLEEIIENHPDSLEAYNNLAVILISQGKHTRASELLSLAMQTDARYQQVYENLGRLYSLLASEAYKRALGSDNNIETPQAFIAFNQITSNSPVDIPAEKSAPIIEAEVNTAPAPVSDPEPPIEVSEDDILHQVRKWADAWARQDVEQYLSYYSPEFVPSDHMSQAEWRKLRRDRVSSPQFIQVIVSDFKVIIFPTNRMASVTFLQEYESNTYNETIKKILLLHKTGGKWLIIQEETGV